MRFMLTLLAMLTLAQPVFAEDKPAADDQKSEEQAADAKTETPQESAEDAATSSAVTTDIMDPYQETRQPYVTKFLDTQQKFHDRWYDHVQERYNITLQKPEEKAKAKDTEAVATDKDVDAAKDLIGKYIDLVTARDPEVTKLYSPDAEIEITFVHQSGDTLPVIVDVRNHQQVIIRDMNKGVKTGDVATYSDLSYKKEGRGVRVTGEIEYTNPKYKTPWSVFVEPNKEGTYQITEEALNRPVGKSR